MDEAGRGPLAWPLFVWLVIKKEELDFASQYPLFQDSKKLTPMQRDWAYQQIQELVQKGKILISTQQISAPMIDRYGVTRAINLAISKGIYALLSQLLQQPEPKQQTYHSLIKLIKKYIKKTKDTIEIILDGKHDFELSKDLGIITNPQVQWDARYPEIAIASILAKVERDKQMQALEQKYPGYGFAQHKGYGTQAHYQALEQLGISDQHRKLFLKKMIPNWKIIPFDEATPFPRD